MGQVFARSTADRRYNALLLGAFAALALLLAVIGIYGVMSYVVSQGAREIGIRLALGAPSRDVMKLVVGQGLVLGAIGVAIGLSAAFALTRLIAGLLYDVSATDLSTFASAAGLLLFVALLACYFPARRATKIDPIVALRRE